MIIMPYNKNTLIYVLTPKASYIPPLRQNGPIVNPLRVSCRIVEKCLQIGVPMSEYDPKTKKVVKLDPMNLYDDTKFDEVIKDTTTSGMVDKMNVSVNQEKQFRDVGNETEIPVETKKENIENNDNAVSGGAPIVNDFNKSQDVPRNNDKKKYRREYNPNNKHEK